MQNCNLKWNNWQPFTFTQRVIITVPTPRLSQSQLSDDNFSPFWQNIQELFITNSMPIKDARWLFHFQCNQHKRVCRGGKKSVLLFMALSLPALYDFLGQNFPSPLKFDSRVRIHHGFLWDESSGRWVAVAGCWSRSNLYSDITFPPLTPIMRGKHTSIKENTQTASCALSPTRGQGGCI